MQPRSRLILVAAAALAAGGTVVVAPTAAFADTCGGYYFKNVSLGGRSWDASSWGVSGF
jgi:hypothetical protein